MENPVHERAVLQRKIKEGTLISADLDTAVAIAKATGAMQDRVNFAVVKRYLSNVDDE